MYRLRFKNFRNPIISLLLVLSIVVGLFPNNVSFGAGEPTDQDEFEDYVQTLGMKPVTKGAVNTTDGFKVVRASYETYEAYGLIVYGTPYIVPNNDRDSNGHRRYLGWNEEGTSLISNALYDNDAHVTTGSAWADKNYVNTNKSGSSLWGSLDSPELKDHVASTPLYNPEIGLATSDGVTAEDIHASGVAYSGPADLYYGTYATLQVAPTWFSEGSIYVKHQTSSGVYYATMYVEGFAEGTELEITPSLSSSSLDMKSNEDSVSFTIDADALIDLDPSIEGKNIATEGHIKNYYLTIQGPFLSTNKSSVKADTFTHSHGGVTVTVPRSSLKLGVNDLSYEIVGHYETDFFDTVEESVKVTVEIDVDEKATPDLLLTGTANPTSREFSGSDVNVTVTADTTVTGVTASEVNYILIDVNGKTYQESGVASITHPFSFKITSATMDALPDDGSHTEEFDITSTAYLKNGDVMVRKASAQTVVYKDSMAPMAVINAPREARLGDDITIIGAGFSPIGLDIEEIPSIWHVNIYFTNRMSHRT